MASQIPGYVVPQGGGSAAGSITSGLSGGIVDSAEYLLDNTFVANEAISGGRAVAFNQSGQLIIAMPGVSGRMPAIGVAPSNYASGNTVTIFTRGRVFNNVFNFSGWTGRPVYVGLSGDLVASGSPSLSGNVQQIVGVSIAGSGVFVQVGDGFQGAVAQSGDVGSGAVLGQAGGGYFSIASGTIGTNDIGSGAIVSGRLGSGVIGSFHIASGQLTGFEFGSGSIVSGRVASGQIGNTHLAATSVLSGHVGSGAILGQAGGGAFNVGSGTLSTYDHGSGTIVRASQFLSTFQSGTGWSLLTGEVISGVRAVCVSQSGNLQIAMASVSGRMPAIGVVVDGVLSGIPANVYQIGSIVHSSGLADYSGQLGKAIWVGRSGQMVTFSGSFNSGGFNLASGGDFIQRMGIAYSSGSFSLITDLTIMQTQLLGILDLVDVVNRSFGV